MSIAQLGEHLPYKQRVIGSSPIVPIMRAVVYNSSFCFLLFSTVKGVFDMIYTTKIKGTDNAESQAIIKKLDPREDILFVYGDLADGTPVEVQFIKPINDITTVGLIDAELAKEIVAQNGEEISVAIPKYELTFEDGVYGITADIEVEKTEESDEEPKKRLPLPLLIVVGALTGVLTVVLFVLRAINKGKKNM